MSELKIDVGKLAPVITVLIVVVLGLGVWQTVQGMQTRVAELELEVERLEDFSDQLSTVEVQVAKVRADMLDLAAARDEILEAMCRLLERPPQQCGVG